MADGESGGGEAKDTDRIDYAAEFLSQLAPRIHVLSERVEQMGHVVRAAEPDGRRRVLHLACETFAELEEVLADARRVIREHAKGRRPSPAG